MKISISKLKAILEESFDAGDVQGLPGYSSDEILSIVKDHVASVMSDNNVSDDEATVTGIAIYGSRNRGTARDDSDLDIVLEYEGTLREDDFFNMLHDDDFEIEGIEVDINPINVNDSGTLQDYLLKAKKYDDEILARK